MNIERDDGFGVSVEDGRVWIEHRASDEGLDLDDARWLQAVALPAALAALTVPSDPPASVAEDGLENGQIPGQLAIE